MNAVLDASAAAEVILARQETRRVSLVLAEADIVWVPELYVFEMTNLLWKVSTMGGLPVEQTQQALARALELPDLYVPGGALVEEVFDLACRLRRPAYDLFYLVLARRHAALLLTMDCKLAKLAADLGVRVE